MLNILQKIVIEYPFDKIIKQVQNLIFSGELKPCENLFQERKLTFDLAVCRGHVKTTAQNPEIYGGGTSFKKVYTSEYYKL